jgi:hypothetical protein
MSTINENCVYAGVCLYHDCACALWGKEYDKDTYKSLKEEYDAELEEVAADIVNK